MKIDGEMIENFISHYFFLTVDWTWLIFKALLAIKVLDVLIFGVQYEKHDERRSSFLDIFCCCFTNHNKRIQTIYTMRVYLQNVENDIAIRNVEENAFAEQSLKSLNKICGERKENTAIRVT